MKFYFQRLIFFVLISLIILPTFAENDRKKSRQPLTSVMAAPDVLAKKAKRDKGSGRPLFVDNVSLLGNGFINDKYTEGIDVSHYQGIIDWDEVGTKAQISYVYIKASEGANLKDEYYLRNLQGARNAGISVGSYHFYRPQVAPEVQLKNMTDIVLIKDQDLVPIIDIEVAGADENQFITDLTNFIHLVTKHYGKKPLLYTYHNFYNKHFLGLFKDYHWMIARYRTDEPWLNDGKSFIMWQYTQRGKLPGIRGYVDRSYIMNGFSLHQLKL